MVRLKRERAGRYVTAAGRFTVEGDAAGAWYAIDAERHDELGLPLVRGPFPTLDAAREAVAEALRTSDHGLTVAGRPAGPIAKARERKGSRQLTNLMSARAPTPHPSASSAKRTEPEKLEPAGGRPRLRAVETPAPPEAEDASAFHGSERPRDRPSAQPTSGKHPTRRASAKGQSDEGPAWMARLQPDQRAAARRLHSLLERAGIDDPALVRREIEADLPDVARALLARSVQRDAVDPWRAGAKAIEELADEAATTEASTTGPGRSRRQTAGPRDARTRAARAAVRRLLARGEADDLALLAWLVALQTSVRIFEAVGGEGRDAGQGLRGWRLVELGAGRAATGRTLAIDEPDLLGE